MEPDSNSFDPFQITSRARPGEYVLLRVRNRLIDMWNAPEFRGVDAVVAVGAIAQVDFCLSRLRAERVNR